MASFELDTYDLSARALSLLRAAVKHARMRPSAESHVVPLADFYGAAGFPSEMSNLQFLDLIKEVKKTSIFSSDFEPGCLRGWLAFEAIALKGEHFEFRLCQFALDASEPREFPTAEMAQLNTALEIALCHADGDPEAFAFNFAAALAGWMSQDMLSAEVAMSSIQLLRRLHPSISV